MIVIVNKKESLTLKQNQVNFHFELVLLSL